MFIIYAWEKNINKFEQNKNYTRAFFKSQNENKIDFLEIGKHEFEKVNYFRYIRAITTNDIREEQIKKFSKINILSPVFLKALLRGAKYMDQKCSP